MSQYVSFDELDQIESTTYRKPFFAIDLSNDDTVLNWLKENLHEIKNQNQTRLEKVKNNILRYKGYQYFNSIYYPRDILETQRKYTPQLVLPLLADSCDEKVARLMEYKPNVVVVPLHDETKDKNDAKVAKRFLNHIDYAQKLDSKFRSILRSSKVSGESFAWVRWNPDLGEVLDDVKILEKAKFVGGDDNPQPQEQIRQGDIEVVKKTSHWVFYERAESWEKVNYCFIVELDYVESLKLDYPEHASDIREESDAKVFDYDKMQEVSLAGKCRKIHFYHKKTKYLPQGFEACFTSGALLKKGPLSYEHGELPIERLIDLENDEELAGQSYFDKVKNIASQINNALNMVTKMMMLAGNAKWFVEGGSVDDQSLNNDINIVKVKPGSKPPVLAQANPVGQGHYTFIEKLYEWFYSFSKSNSVIRGEPPPGVTAGVALQYVSESESRRLTTEVSILNQFVRNVYDKCLKTAAQYYKADEPRTLMILGNDNRWTADTLDVAALSGNYSLQIQNTSGLSDSKAVKTQQVIDLNNSFPGLVPREQVLEMTGLAQGDKFLDVGSIAVKASEDENEWIQDGKGMIEPADWEDHIIHWQVHTAAMQSLGFKTKAPTQIINQMIDHVRAHEMFMMDMAEKNPMYKQLLIPLKGFPMFMEMPLPPMPLPPPQEMPQPSVPQGPAPQEPTAPPPMPMQ